MNYRDRLTPWAVFRCPTPVNICVRRFRRRPDAEEYMKILSQSEPETNFEVVFDKEESPQDNS